MTYVKQEKGWKMSCNVGKAAEGLQNELWRQLPNILDMTSPGQQRMRISDQKVCIRFHQGGLHTRRPMRSFALNQRNRGNRRNWALPHQHRTIAEWRNVIFADETRIGLRPDTRCVSVWRSARRHQEH